MQLNLSRPIEEQGPLDVIIHKLTDVILEADQNDSQSLELVHRFQVSGGGEEGRPGTAPRVSVAEAAAWLRGPRKHSARLGLGLVVGPFSAGASVPLGVRRDRARPWFTPALPSARVDTTY